MEEITYNDVLVHYQRMMADITDELQQLENSLEKISVFSQQTWKGKAGDACFEKLQELCDEVKKAAYESTRALGSIQTGEGKL